jgi:hypothetical protein
MQTVCQAITGKWQRVGLGSAISETPSCQAVTSAAPLIYFTKSEGPAVIRTVDLLVRVDKLTSALNRSTTRTPPTTNYVVI